MRRAPVRRAASSARRVPPTFTRVNSSNESCDATSAAAQFTLAVIMLPHQALVSIDAIVRTLVRMFVTRRRLLEWQTASQVEAITAGHRQAVPRHRHVPSAQFRQGQVGSRLSGLTRASPNGGAIAEDGRGGDVA